MAYPGSHFGYHQAPTDAGMDRKPPIFIDEDESSVLDTPILDSDIMQSPGNIAATFRKNSFANSNGVLSPAESQGWDHQYGSGGGMPVEAGPAGGSIPFHNDHHVFGRPSNPPPPGYAHPHPHHPHHHPPPWTFEHGSGNRTPTTGIEYIHPPPPFDGTQYAHHMPIGFNQQHGPPPPPPPFGGPHSDAGFIPAPQVQTPMSPHSHQDWMGMAQQEMENRPAHKRSRLGSPPRTLVDWQRKDGIRKKNGRIDIPQERNIETIEEMIEKTTDEELLKELKQQKRLLRNREAALASRQRKKKHTEDLEVKEKGYTQQITLLENKLSDLTIEREHRERERQMVHQRLQEAQRIIDTVHEEKRELIRKHTEETSILRKRIQVLADQLDAIPAPIMSAAPSSTGFTDFNAEMEALNMGPHDWDNFIFANDLRNDDQGFSFDLGPEPTGQPSARNQMATVNTVAPPAPKRPSDSTVDQASASGLLFMLLLCGAFVASKPPSASFSDLPKMPPDVRAAAPKILNNLLSESNVPSTYGRGHSMTDVAPEPIPSSHHLHTPSRTSRLDRLHRSLTSPTKQQEIDQAFSLTTAQYASMTNIDFPMHNNPPLAIHSGNVPQPRRNLAEALTTMEEEHRRNSKAEVYTRSLLWDQIPTDVVKQFKEMVRDHEELEARQHQPSQQQQQHTNDDFGFKMEP